MSAIKDDVTLITKIAACQQDGAPSRKMKKEATSAISELYDRYSRLVFSLASQIVGDKMIAEEVTQDVFLQVWNKASTFRPESGKVISWLSSVTRYRAIDILRRQNARPEGHDVALDDGFSLEEGYETAVEPAVDEELERQKVHRALMGLPSEQRKALALAFFLGMTQEEISMTLNEPLGTIKTRIRLAMQKLRQSLVDKEQKQ